MKLGYRPRHLLRQTLPGVVRWYDENLSKLANAQV